MRRRAGAQREFRNACEDASLTLAIPVMLRKVKSDLLSSNGVVMYLSSVVESDISSCKNCTRCGVDNVRTHQVGRTQRLKQNSS